MTSSEQLISERVMLKRDSYFAVSAPDGSMRPDEFIGDGLWRECTRLLSGLRVLVDGREPRTVGLRNDDSSATFELEAGSLRLRRERFIDEGLHERLTLTNTGTATAEARIDIDVASDFAAMLGVREAVRELAHPERVAPTHTAEGVRFVRDGMVTDVRATPGGLRHEVNLRPGETYVLRWDVGREVADFDAGQHASRDIYRSWAAESMSIRTDNPMVNELLERANADVRLLINRYTTGIYPTAGLPWYAVPFGRDALITAILLLPVNPEIARGVLRYLARHQGRRFDERTEEEPGRILHEVRFGEAVERGLWPHILYGTVDATPLFVCAVAETDGWTHDNALVDELWPAAEAALEWCARYGDTDGDGYIEHSGGYARNEGWKDSGDSLTNADGSDVLRPAALCEVQAYLWRALAGMSRRWPDLADRADRLRRSFNRDFWMPEEEFFAQALDGSKRQVRAITSNPGHCMWMGAVDPALAAGVARRLLAPELFSGWGVRTLSSRSINYDPCSYHNGSVWPFDSAIAVAGLRRYGFAAEAERVARALLEAAMEFPLRRPPELFCGADREPGGGPRAYWNTCTPQLWSAAAMFACVAAILGLRADPSARTLGVAPVETALWKRIEVTGLHFAGERLDFAVEGAEIKASKLPNGFSLETA